MLNEYVHPNALELLRKNCTVVDNFDRPDEVEAIILRVFEAIAAVMDMCRNLKVIGTPHIGACAGETLYRMGWKNGTQDNVNLAKSYGLNFLRVGANAGDGENACNAELQSPKMYLCTN